MANPEVQLLTTMWVHAARRLSELAGICGGIYSAFDTTFGFTASAKDSSTSSEAYTSPEAGAGAGACRALTRTATLQTFNCSFAARVARGNN